MYKLFGIIFFICNFLEHIRTIFSINLRQLW